MSIFTLDLVHGSSYELFFAHFMMELADETLSTHRDWDPIYLSDIFGQDFYDFDHLWRSNMGDQDLVHAIEVIERYNPLVEDISLDDDTLYEAVEDIEVEYK